jgi:hypothetical protein
MFDFAKTAIWFAKCFVFYHVCQVYLISEEGSISAITDKAWGISKG